MKIFDPADIYTKERFRQLGMMYLSSKSLKSLTITDSPQELKEYLGNPDFKSLISRDKICISKYSKFPSLFLSKIENIDIKRTISLDKADKIIIDEFSTVKIDSYYSKGVLHIIKKENDVVLSFLSYTSQNDSDVISHFKSINELDSGSTYTVEKIPIGFLDIDYELSSIIVNYPDKLVKTSTLNEYVANFLPELDLDTLDSIRSLLQSQDKGAVKVGVELLHTFDASSIYLDTVSTLYDCYNNIVQYQQHNSAAFNHIESMLDISKDILSTSYKEDFFTKIFDNLNDNDKSKIRELMRKYLESMIKSQTMGLINKYNFEINVV